MAILRMILQLLRTSNAVRVVIYKTENSSKGSTAVKSLMIDARQAFSEQSISMFSSDLAQRDKLTCQQIFSLDRHSLHKIQQRPRTLLCSSKQSVCVSSPFDDCHRQLDVKSMFNDRSMPGQNISLRSF